MEALHRDFHHRHGVPALASTQQGFHHDGLPTLASTQKSLPHNYHGIPSEPEAPFDYLSADQRARGRDV